MKAVYLLIALLLALPAHADKAKLLANDKDALQARVDFIQQAKSEILAEYFSVWNDDQSVGGFALLLEAAKRGVKVKVLMDALSNTVPKSFFTTMMEHGRDAQGNINIEIKLYNPLSLNLLKATHRDHSKMLIIDGERMITGGRNVGDKYFGLNHKRNFSDLDIMVSGDVVQKAREDFLAAFNSKISKPSAKVDNLPSKLILEKCEKLTQRDIDLCERRKKATLRAYSQALQRITKNLDDILVNTPTSVVQSNTNKDWLADVEEGADLEFMSHQPDQFVSEETADLSHALRELAASTKRDLNILSPYLIPTKNTFIVFEELIKKGVKVRIVTNSLLSTDNLFAQAGYLAAKDKLIALGVELYEFNGPDTSHGKACVIDDTAAFVGTYNLDPRSAFLNREVGILVKSSPGNQVANELTQEIESFRKNSLLVGKDGQAQNVEEQQKRLKTQSQTKRAALKIIQLFVPLFRSQI